MATLLTKKSDTASSVPLAADLTNAAGGAELAVNTADKRLYSKTSGGTVVELGTNPSSLALPNGSVNGVPYLNGSKVLTSGSALTFDGTSLKNSASSSGATPSANGNQLVLESSGNAGLTIATGASSLGNIFFADSGDSADGFIQYDQSGRSLRFGTATAEKMRLDSSGNLGLGVTPSAWGASFKALEIGGAGTGLFSGTGTTPQTYLTANGYFNGTNWIYKGSAAAARYSQSASGHEWSIAPSGTAGNAISFTQAMTLNANGQLLLGTTSAGTTDAPLIVSNGGAAGMEFSPTAISGENRLLSYNRSGSSYAGFTLSAADIKFQTGGTERARIDSSGNLLVGTTSALGKLTLEASPGNLTTPNFSSRNNSSVGSSYALHFNVLNSSGSQVGYISANGTATFYATSSDYRLKDTVEPMTGALAKVIALKPCTYKWKSDGSKGEGFIAHELGEVCPQAVTGEKDAVDADGNPVYQGIDTSFLVATLTAAIQEQQATINQLKARLDAANL